MPPLPKLLFLSPIAPDREGIGPARRADAVINALGRTHEVTLLVVAINRYDSFPTLLPDFLDGRWTYLPLEPNKFEKLREVLGRRFPLLYRCLWRWPSEWSFLTRTRQKRVRMRMVDRRFEVVHAYRFSMARFALELQKDQSDSTYFHLDIDDIESICARRRAGLLLRNNEIDQVGYHGYLARAYARAERILLPRFDRLYVCSEVDRTKLEVEHEEVRVLPNTVPDSLAVLPSNNRERQSDRLRFLFFGALRYSPNKDAVDWFCSDLFPQIRTHRSCTFLVGGFAMPTVMQELLSRTPGADSIGSFATATDGFSQGDVLVVPLRSGGGTRIKILESFAVGRPVISTTIGVEGIAAVAERDFLLADSPEEWVRQSIRLIDDPQLRKMLSDNARRLVVARYSSASLVEVLATGSVPTRPY